MSPRKTRQNKKTRSVKKVVKHTAPARTKKLIKRTAPPRKTKTRRKIKRTPRYLKATTRRKDLPTLPDSQVWALKTLSVFRKRKFIKTVTKKTRKIFLKKITPAEYKKTKARAVKMVKGRKVYYARVYRTVSVKTERVFYRKKIIGEIIRWVKEEKQPVKIREKWRTYQAVENELRDKRRMSPDGEIYNVLRYDERTTMPEYVETNTKFGYHEPQLPLENFVYTAMIVWALMKIYGYPGHGHNYVVAKFPMKLGGEYTFSEIKNNFLPLLLKKINTEYRRKHRQFLSLVTWTAVGRPKTAKQKKEIEKLYR